MNKLEFKQSVYEYKGLEVVKYPNGLYMCHFFVNDFEYDCVVSAWTEEEFIENFENFVSEYGGLVNQK